MFTHAGQDASAVFQVFHSGAAYDQLAQFCVGECKDVAAISKSAEFEADYAKLFAEVASRGLFRARYVAVVQGTLQNHRSLQQLQYPHELTLP